MTTVSVRGVSKSFGSLAVLRSLDLEVADASLTAILGPSGSGKTTLLRIIAGFERADGGTVAIGDDTVDDGPHYVPPERRGIGYVPQEGALFPHLTVLGNIGFGVRRRRRRRRGSEAGRLSELLDLVGLHGLERRYPHQLSGGQQQRVALARALAIEPKLVLLDEPFASLDAALRSTVRADVARILRAAGATALLVTHDQEEALAMADHIAILRRGQITPTAPPQEFYAFPLDPDMAAFVGEANLLPGTIDGTHAITVLGALPLRGDPPALDGARTSLATVLVRPEQVEIGRVDERGGIAGRVVATDYHGHDVLVTIQPDHHGVEQRVTARVEGARSFGIGDAVSIRAHGSVMAWPKTAD